jgi:hypothetical protein
MKKNRESKLKIAKNNNIVSKIMIRIVLFYQDTLEREIGGEVDVHAISVCCLLLNLFY